MMAKTELSRIQNVSNEKRAEAPFMRSNLADIPSIRFCSQALALDSPSKTTTRRTATTEFFSQHLIPACVFVLILMVCGNSDCVAQDTIVARTASGKSAKYKGEIVDWVGSSLTLATGSRQKEIDNDAIIEIQTAWEPEYTEALKQIEVQQFKSAIENLKIALASESRPWAERLIQARLVESYSATEDWVEAGKSFLAITKGDPQTRFFDIMPLAWTAGLQMDGVTRTAATWMASNEPAAQLLGASWATGGQTRDTAIAKLEELTSDIDRNIAGLALAQLWRSRSITATDADLKVWEKKISEQPESLRAGFYFVLSTAQSRLGQTDQAMINLMRIPILYPDQHTLSAAALYRCGNLLNNQQRTDEANRLWSELKRDYPQSSWAKQLKNRMDVGG